jgi:hypothetical protein
MENVLYIGRQGAAGQILSEIVLYTVYIKIQCRPYSYFLSF